MIVVKSRGEKSSAANMINENRTVLPNKTQRTLGKRIHSILLTPSSEMERRFLLMNRSQTWGLAAKQSSNESEANVSSQSANA